MISTNCFAALKNTTLAYLSTITFLLSEGDLLRVYCRILSEVARPQYQDNAIPTSLNEFQYDDYNVDANVDPNYRPYPSRQPPIRRPNQVFYDSTGAVSKL
ncbi:hypothetical protein GQX74_005773 [Glossina fuscipes]|nr:hypothetical protein GQX74_005773 [Glossina fuscipes]